MEFVKGTPYFYNCREKIKCYPYLNKDISTDILIVGGGIDGAIANYYLSEKYDTTLIDKGRLSTLCTSCATALLEYQLDEFAEDLKSELSEEEIIGAYKMGLSSIEKLRQLTSRLGNTFHFALRPTLLYSSNKKDTEKFVKEYEFRKKHGLNAEYFDKENNPFSFKIEAGVYAKDGGAELSPYLFTKKLIESACNQHNIFENTEFKHIVKLAKGYKITTSYGEIITANKIVFATGFDWSLFSNRKLFTRYTTYTIVTEPINELSIYTNALIHDNITPYHYLRKLPDGRLIYGGEDALFINQNNECLAEIKYNKLLNSLKKMFPAFSDKLKTAYKFCGAFGQTKNNLGLIGKSEDSNTLYFLSCGANGIINALFGADLLLDIFKGKSNPLEKAFSPLR